jgi:putative DNA primase/helicase
MDQEARMSDKLVDIRAQVEARRREEQEAIDALTKEKESDKKSGVGGPDDPRFIRQCLDANVLGDGILYAAIHRGKFIYNKNSEQWLRWAGHHWEHDVMGRHLSAVENVVDKYLDYVETINDEIAHCGEDDADKRKSLQTLRKRFLRRVDRLRDPGGRRNCVEFSHTLPEGSLAVRGDKLDADPYLLAFQNGVIDLRSGAFRPGKPQDYLVKAVPHDWKGIDCPAPHWDEALREIFAGPDCEDIIDFLYRTLGYAISGLNVERFFLLLYGEHGQNGKGTILEVILHCMGPLAAPIAPEMLLDQGRNRSSSGPSPDIMSLRGLRLAFGSETDDGCKFSTAALKRFTGGESLTGRNPHDKLPTTFAPSHTLCLMTNFLPQASAEDAAFWTRMKVIEFAWSFVEKPNPDKPWEKPRQRDLLEKLKGEASGILARLVKGFLHWQALGGISPPPAVNRYTEKYQYDQDCIGQFIEARCYTSASAWAWSSQLYEAFKEWYEETWGRKPPAQKTFGSVLTKKGYERIKEGKIKYQGLGLKDEEFGG